MLSQRTHGFTLIELMIALTFNILLLSALIYTFSSNLNQYDKVITTDKMNQQLQQTLTVMSKEIRRAGYWSTAYNDIGTNTNSNPFMAVGLDIQTPSTNCILFSYDANADGTLPSISASLDDKRYGFRLLNQIIQERPPGAPFDCAANVGAWNNMTDPQVVRITNLSFTLNSQVVPIGATTRMIQLRSVDISITGQSTADASVTQTLTQHVRIRNDKFAP